MQVDTTMNIKEMHRLLRRQIKKFGVSESDLERFPAFFQAVQDAYVSFDQDLEHLEHVLENSSQELYKVNRLLQDDVALKSIEVEKAQARLEHIVNNVRNVIFQTNLKGEWVYLNCAWEQLSGYTVNESLGKYYADFLMGSDEGDFIGLVSLVANKDGFLHKVLPITSRDGEKKWIDISVRLTRDMDGKPDGTIGNIADVTELKNSEIDLRLAKERLSRANKAKETFLSTMSHEIRTPLHGVIGIANILMIEDHLPSQTENLNTLLFSAQHLLGLINDLIDINKIQSGKIEFESSEFDFNTLLQGLRKSFGYNAQEKGIRFVIKKDETIPNVLIGDSTRLLQVLTNLIGNAMKFTTEGRVVLDLEVVEESKEDIKILFQVKDTGIGIKEENLDKIFERFTQAESSTTRKYGGTGLGLTICKSLLVQQGTDLQVESTYGKGSNFHFEINFKKTDRFKLSAPAFMDLQPSYSEMNDCTVLVAEDNHVNIRVIKRLLDKWKVKYTIVENGQEALDALDEKDFNLILMDIQMPIMDGYTATEIIRARTDKKYHDIPIIALTASADVEIQRKAKESGISDFMSKPFNPVKLYNKLKSYRSSVHSSPE